MVDLVRREVRGMITDLQGLNSVGVGAIAAFNTVEATKSAHARR